MSLRFYIGASGSGKTTALEEELIRRSMDEPERQFMMMVPDQFTMHTQKELVDRHPRKGIMNIDVQSFGRLCHKLGAELGEEERLVLDDTGKNLILRHLAGKMMGDLPSIGSSLKRSGYIHEVKSVISEFMQYGIGVEDVKRLEESSKDKPILCRKLRDIGKMYEAFKEYMAGHYITREEKLDVLAEQVEKSRTMQGAVVAFDGFTGFTPVQNGVIARMLLHCKEVIVTLIMPPEELDSYRKNTDEHRLFALSVKTMLSLEQLAKDLGVERGEDVSFPGNPVWRYREHPALAHLEHDLFRGTRMGYPTGVKGLRVISAPNPEEELRRVFLRIHQLVHEGGYACRDMAIVSGDPERYEAVAERLSSLYGIPLFADRNRKLDMNPFTETLKGILKILSRDFTADSVVPVLKSGFFGLSRREISDLEEYLMASGLRGYSSWKKPFARRTGRILKDSEELAAINVSRERIMAMLEPVLEFRKGGKAEDITLGLYRVMEGNGIYEKLKEYEEYFAGEGDALRQREFAQVYRTVCQLLEQIGSILAGEELTVEEYLEIFEAGLLEVKIGVIPQDVDHVVLGDMERTRLTGIKHLFFVGCNDGVIPASSGGGGLISDLDREFLGESGFVLAPTPRQKMYVQRLYLYHILTRPTEELWISYANVNSKGESQRPSYLIGTLKGLFPRLQVEEAGAMEREETLRIPGAEVRTLASCMAAYADRSLPEEEWEFFFTVFDDVLEREPETARRLADTAFYRYHPKELRRQSSESLYGKVLKNSVSRLESFASCAYAHFLNYGLRLKEREVSALAQMDIGSLYHSILEGFGRQVKEEGKAWETLSEADMDRILEMMAKQEAEKFGLERIRQDAKTSYRFGGMMRILRRSIRTMCYQLRKGKFRPSEYELKFISPLRLPGEDRGRMNLTGKIDRIDTMEEGGKLYLKVVDYKSGNKLLDYRDLYSGQQMQLLVYLYEAMQEYTLRNPGKKVVPAAVFYYLLKDPILNIKDGKAPTEEEARDKGLAELKMDGLIQSLPEVLKGLDEGLQPGENSDVAPFGYLKKGDISATSHAREERELEAILRFTVKKMESLGERMLKGDIGVCPADRKACDYCSFKEGCIFDTKTRGFEYGDEKLSAKEALEQILEEGRVVETTANQSPEEGRDAQKAAQQSREEGSALKEEHHG